MERKTQKMTTGHIVPTWNYDVLESLVIDPHHEIYRGFDLVDEKDRNRYPTSVAHDVHRDLPEFLNIDIFEKEFNWLSEKSYALHRMRPGMLLPLHRDRYRYYSQSRNLKSTKNIVRIIVFLSDWASGHYLEIDETPIVNWRAGDWVSWQDDTTHLAANLGHKNRYTLQITGIDNSLLS